MSNFDYGKTLPDGQHQRHPTVDQGNLVAPIRNAYIHDACGGKTVCGDSIALSYARNPTYYNGTFCATCGGYYPVSEFKWAADGVRLGEIGGEAGKDLREPWPGQSKIR